MSDNLEQTAELQAAHEPKSLDDTKDSGAVKIGGGAIYYGDATKDIGRVRIGGGAIIF